MTGDYDLIVIGGGAAGLGAARAAATETPAILRRWGIEVSRAHAAFTSPSHLRADGQVLSARAFVIATGSRPAVPLVPGLDQVPYLTSENVFALASLPASLAILGGGPVGCELALAFGRLGTQVTILEGQAACCPAPTPTRPRSSPECSAPKTSPSAPQAAHIKPAVTRSHYTSPAEGPSPRSICWWSPAGSPSPITSAWTQPESGWTTAAASSPTITGHHQAGHLRGRDITGRMPFTHAAHAMGRLAARNALRHRWSHPGRFITAAIPWVVFTAPEVAQAGLTEQQAARCCHTRVAYLPMSELDRAVTAGRTDGFVKIIAGPRQMIGNAGGGRVLGATIVAARAGEMIHEPAPAIRTGMFTGRLAQATHAYPTWSLAIQQAAAQFFGTHGGRTAHPPRTRADR